MRGWARAGLLAAALAGASVSFDTARAALEPFGQETVDTRKPRYQRAPQPAGSHNHQHGNDQSHNHAHSGHTAHQHLAHEGHVHGMETEHLFGFVSGADVHHQGAKIAMVEIAGRLGKRAGRYEAFGKRYEFAYGVTDSFNAALSLSAARHKINGVTGFDDVNNALVFNGIGGEFRWNFVKRTEHGVGITAHIEPVIQRYDELSGLRARKYGAENRLIFDTELSKDKLFAAFNVLYEVERVLEQGETEWERGSKLGFAFALTGRVSKTLFLGMNAQYMRSYEGLIFKEFTGEAFYVGPTLYATIGESGFVSLAWNRQVWGQEAGSDLRLDLANFERDLFRVRAGIHF